MATILAIDDDPLILKCFRLALAGDGLALMTAQSGTEGLRLFDSTRPDVVLVDVCLPDVSGLDVFRQIHERDARVPVVLLTGYGSATTAIEAMRLGAFEYLVKPVDPDDLAQLAACALEVSRLMRTPARLSNPDEPEPDGGDLLVGNSPGMREVYKAVGRVAPQDVTVLILGESGTGKELVARALYQYGRRAAGPLLAMNCAAIPENLLESELFGHEKGAFTGADRRRIGKFEQCHGGTLFLDEIGDMTPLAQAKVLRVLQEKAFERVGGSETVSADVRVIAATHRDLEARCATGRFRQDLYFRLNVYTIKLPPLRERGDDLTLLVNHFVRRFGRELGKEMRSIADDTLDVLGRYPWPGNVRELQSILKQALLHSVGPVLVPAFLPPAVLGQSPPASVASSAPSANSPVGKLPDLRQLILMRLGMGATELHAEVTALVDRLLIEEVMKFTKGNQSQAARVLGISRPTLRARLTAMGQGDTQAASDTNE
jgi:two-component system nitrogen regulation response regulator GlnG